MSRNVQNKLITKDSTWWKQMTGEILSSQPTTKSIKNDSKLKEKVIARLKVINVKVRVWQNPSDPKNMDKTYKDLSIRVNESTAEVWTSFFSDLYINAPDFVITSVFGYKEDVKLGWKSAHQFGAAIDINSGTSGNNGKAYTKEEWQKLDETHSKYEIIYQNSPVVRLAHAYTLVWGGDSSNTGESLNHFSFLGDGMTREQRIQTYGYSK